jgi:hypothetical protein
VIARSASKSAEDTAYEHALRACDKPQKCVLNCTAIITYQALAVLPASISNNNKRKEKKAQGVCDFLAIRYGICHSRSWNFPLLGQQT